MYGIIAFIKKFYFSILFVVLEITSLIFVFSNNYYHQAGYFNSSNQLAGDVYSAYSGFTSYFNLKKVNRQLAEENTHLLNIAMAITDTSSFKKIVKTNSYGQQYNFILAEVINNSTNLPNNYLTLNKGSQDSIAEGMAVIGPAGIVGIVLKVSKHYSVVMSMLHKKTLLSAMFKKSGTFGTLSWGDKMDYRFANLAQIPMSEKVKIGDTIVTSGYSNMFPKGIMVGFVDSFKPVPQQYFYNIRVRLSTDFSNLKYVYVVSDLKKIEKTSLEQDAQNLFNEKTK